MLEIIYLYAKYTVKLFKGLVTLAERSEIKSNVKLDEFRSHLRASYVSSFTEEFW